MEGYASAMAPRQISRQRASGIADSHNLMVPCICRTGKAFGVGKKRQGGTRYVKYFQFWWKWLFGFSVLVAQTVMASPFVSEKPF